MEGSLVRAYAHILGNKEVDKAAIEDVLLPTPSTTTYTGNTLKKFVQSNNVVHLDKM